jgi:hypothetical protein
MGYRHRYMYYLTGLPGWVRFGFSPGWLGRSPTGLPPTAHWLIQSGLLPKYLGQIRLQATAYSEEQERIMLEQQIKILESQLEAVRKRLEELRGKDAGR